MPLDLAFKVHVWFYTQYLSTLPGLTIFQSSSISLINQLFFKIFLYRSCSMNLSIFFAFFWTTFCSAVSSRELEVYVVFKVQIKCSFIWKYNYVSGLRFFFCLRLFGFGFSFVLFCFFSFVFFSTLHFLKLINVSSSICREREIINMYRRISLILWIYGRYALPFWYDKTQKKKKIPGI